MCSYGACSAFPATVIAQDALSARPSNAALRTAAWKKSSAPRRIHTHPHLAAPKAKSGIHFASVLETYTGGIHIVKIKIFAALFCFVFSFFSCASIASAQKLPPTTEARLKLLLKYESALNPEQRTLFSGSVRSALALAHQLFDPKSLSGDDDGGLQTGLRVGTQSSVKSRAVASPQFSISPAAPGHGGTNVDRSSGITKISHPEVGLQLSRWGGFSQFGSSSASCGQTIVTGYFSGPASALSAVVPFLADPSLFPSVSSVGVAFSNDGGETFTELPFLNAGPPADPSALSTFNFNVGGNTSVGCSSPQRFYAINSPFTRADLTTTTGLDGNPIQNLEFLNGVGISISSDGGEHWADPAPVIYKNENHLLDSAWLAVDPHDPNRLYVSYLDFDFSGLFLIVPETPRCPNALRIGSELVTSSDGGRTWSTPAIIREDCLASDPFLTPQGFHVASTRIAVGADGKLSAAYVLFVPIFGSDGTTVVDFKIQVNFRQSADHGRSFGPEVKVSDLVQIGDGSHSFRPAIQGFFLTPTIPVLAADPVKHGGKSTLYIAWNDGRDNPQPDLAAAFGTYNFADVVLSKSTDGGSTWSAPRPVSPTPRDFAGPGRDQFLPAIAVDREGTLAVCYYDRRNDPQNNAIDRYCSISLDRGQNFHDIRQTAKNWVPAENWDLFEFWLGDYDTIAPPFLDGGGGGIFGSFQISADSLTGVFGRSINRE